MGRIGANYWFRTKKEARRFAAQINSLYPHLPKLLSIPISIANSVSPIEKFKGDLMIIEGGWSRQNEVVVRYNKSWVDANQDKVFTIHPLSLVEVKL